MKIATAADAPATRFENAPAKGVTGRVLIGKADGADKFCMRLFELDPDGHTPKHQHDWEHEIFIHAGSGAVLRNGQWVPLQPGTAVFIPANEEHQIRNTGDVPLVFICLIPAGPPEL